MARSNRPELIKDNPAAPQVYVRWRKRTTPARVAAIKTPREGMKEALRQLAEAAAAFAAAAPTGKRTAVTRDALMEALELAQAALAEASPPPVLRRRLRAVRH